MGGGLKYLSLFLGLIILIYLYIKYNHSIEDSVHGVV